MPIPHPSFLYRENSEPPKVPLPLEARKMHVCSSSLPCAKPDSDTHLYDEVGPWVVLNPDEVDTLIPEAYASRHDILNGGRGARTGAEQVMNCYVRPLVREGGKLQGWSVVERDILWMILMHSRRPRTENYRGESHCFDIVFLRTKTYGCTIDAKAPAGTSESEIGRRSPPPQPAVRWEWRPELEMPLSPEPGSATLQPRPPRNDAPETTPASEWYFATQYPAEDTTSDDDSGYVLAPSTAHTEQGAGRQRGSSRAGIETRATARPISTQAEWQLENEGTGGGWTEVGHLRGMIEEEVEVEEEEEEEDEEE
ncbi:MAG: hypothetical protein ALECFALPRED_010462 [Alectoria fallacina]|uniref:Uncharacterized protein n=1 Tax=Alectoria fallacina TaxID=1903189 RepID=A0A8H3I5T0_9LECA|nr:MAG: hypothetical protein ALECFALPRED_010462 [Alectoria fallacina]